MQATEDYWKVCLGVMFLVSFLGLSTQYVTRPYAPANSSSENKTIQNELSGLEESMTALNDLVNVHRQVWQKQVEHEEQMREKEAARSRNLEREQIILREKSRKLSREIKLLTKNITPNGQSGFSLGDTGVSSIFDKSKDCSDIYLRGDETSGVYRLWPTRSQHGTGFLAYCDMDTDGGGWTVIHRRTSDGLLSDYYSRSWNDYKHGFGDLESSFWLGNEQLHQLTNQGAYELRIDMETKELKTYSIYRSFFIDDETAKYRLHVAGYDSDRPEDDVMTFHNGARFSTYDTDTRYWRGYGEGKQENCAEDNSCGWWFKSGCKLDEKIKLTQNQEKMEMKIRQRLYSTKLTVSNGSVPLIG